MTFFTLLNEFKVSCVCLQAPAKKSRDFLPFLHRSGRRIPAVVEYVLSGHRFKLLIPKETCSIAFAFSGVRCPGRDEPYSDEAIALMRRKIMQRDVEVFSLSNILVDSSDAIDLRMVHLHRLKWKLLIEREPSWDPYGKQGPTWQWF